MSRDQTESTQLADHSSSGNVLLNLIVNHNRKSMYTASLRIIIILLLLFTIVLPVAPFKASQFLFLQNNHETSLYYLLMLARTASSSDPAVQ